MGKFCTHCGIALSPGAAFCDACGQLVRPSDTPGSGTATGPEDKAQVEAKLSKRSPLVAATTIVALLIMVALAGLLWPMNEVTAARDEKTAAQRDAGALASVMGRWASTRGDAVAQFEFTPETLSTLGQTIKVSYAVRDGAVFVNVGEPPRELAKLVVVNPQEIRMEGAATVNLYRIN